MEWVVAVPAWGERCLGLFERHVFPAVDAALRHARVCRPLFIVHTDNAARLKPLFLGRYDVDFHAAPLYAAGGGQHTMLGICQRDALAQADGKALALLTGDCVVSREFFAAAEAAFATGKKAIMSAGTRTVGAYPPIGASAQELGRWAWDNRHPWISNLVYGEGKGENLSLVYFRLRDGVAMHGFHLGPVALLPHAGLAFKGLTSDDDLAEQFTRDELHVVTDEFALAEMSPFVPHAAINPRPVVDRDKVALFASRSQMRWTHKWFFTHRIRIHGTCEDASDVPVCEEILALI